jgi:MFS family permease
MLSEEEAKWLSSVPLACGIVACVAGGLLSDWIVRRTGNRKWGRRWHGLVGYGCAGLAILSTIWVRDVWALGALLSAAFFFFDLTMGPAWAACADIGERHAGTVGGAMNMIGNFGAAAGAKMAGYLFGKEIGGFAGNEIVFVLFACSFWLGALSWLRVDVTEPLGERQ